MKGIRNLFVNALKGINKIYLILIGFTALLWFLIRVIPKPSRATYPCQRVAFPIASGFIIWLTVNITALFGIKKLTTYYKRKGNRIAIFLSVVLMAFYILWIAGYPNQVNYSRTVKADEIFIPEDSANSPVGTGRGIFPGRVIWAFDTTAVKWSGSSGYWWADDVTDQAEVSDMLSRSLQQLSGKDNDVAAWDTLFRNFNFTHGRGNIGYSAGEKIAIKLSLVQSSNPSSNGGNSNFTTPQTALALLRQLVYNAGADAADIYFYDIMRSIPTSVTIRCKEEFPDVHFVGSQTGQYQETYTRDTTKIHWSEELTLELTGGNTAYLPDIITEASYIINLANLKGHRYVGVTGCSKNHFGSMDADGDPNTPHAIGLHPYVTVHDFIIPSSAEWSFLGREDSTYNALVDLMGHKDLGEKTVLFMIDGLYSVPTESDANTYALRWQIPPFNNHFSSSIFISQDNCAIESVTIDFMRAEQAVNSEMTQEFSDGTGTHNVIFGNIDNYLHEAAQADNPPSGTYYSPNGDGVRLPSLGVHEHWNNPADKQYSRNLGFDYGIELYTIAPTLPAPLNLSLDRSSYGSVLLSWSNDGLTNGNIVVYKSVGSATNFEPIAIAEGNAENVEDTDTTEIAVYYYRIKRVDGNTYSPFSNEVNVTIAEEPDGVRNSFTDNSFTIYPNPVREILNFNIENDYSGLASIFITNISGKTVTSLQTQKSGGSLRQSINVSELPKGMYYITLSMKDYIYSKSFTIE